MFTDFFIMHGFHMDSLLTNTGRSYNTFGLTQVSSSMYLYSTNAAFTFLSANHPRQQ